MIEIKNLSIIYENFTIVEDVNLTVKKGERVGIVGESGSGKSVTALSVMKLLPGGFKVTGNVKVNHQDIYLLNERDLNSKIRWKTVSVIFQDPSSALNPLLKIGNQIEEAIIYHEGRRKNIRESVISLLRKAAIPDAEVKYESYPHQLSGGLKQRVMIAMAIACNPDFIIADEPTTALDKKTEREIIFLLNNLVKEENTGLLFISHDFDVISEITDRVYVMYAGYVMESGRTENILKTPFHPYTKGLIACIPKVEGKGKRKLPVLPGNVPDIKSKPSGCPFHPRCERAKEICKKELPEIKEINGREVRCFFPIAGS
ncbi:ABC transporter ATP-binding protein [Desulfurobacterium sp.]|uniref:ABC transporter ATP-binding protein n=1 Tax=Desulfurobacterium sp. TaxID=2004706 RepID=UPI00261F6B90|nr:ABC transporter ATP-binding protein [Desulfurobacterium sp.]